jgi:lipid A 3-O-deacylase
MRVLLAAVLLVGLVSGLARPASAETGLAAWFYEVKAGLLYHDVDNLWSGFRREDGVDINGEVIFAPKIDLFGGALRAALGGSWNTGGDTSKAYLDLRYMYEFDNGIFLSAGGGGAIHDGDTDLKHNDRKALGSRLLFHIPAEVGYRFAGHHALSVYFDHISNAYLADENEGMDTLGVRYGYRFGAPGAARP